MARSVTADIFLADRMLQVSDFPVLTQEPRDHFRKECVSLLRVAQSEADWEKRVF